MSTSAYPFERWPRMGRDEAALARQCARRLPLGAPRRAVEDLRELLGAPLAIRTATPRVLSEQELGQALADPLVAAVLIPPATAGTERVVLELDPRLALCIVDRALGGEAGPDVGVPLVPLGEPDRGVLGYVLGRALADASEPPWRLAAVVTSPAAVHAALGDGPAACWSASLRLGDDSGTARAWLGARALGALPPQDGPRLAGVLSGVSLELVAEAGEASLPAADVASLRAGDVVVLDAAWCEPGAAADAGAEAAAGRRARMRIAGARRTSWWCSIDEEGLRLQSCETTAEAPRTEGKRMQDEGQEQDTDRVMEQAGDAPVELSVEIARMTLPLEELGALKPGEVLATGRAVGERVTLRAGPRAIASGELVDVDGEVGVRILELAE